MPRDLDIYVLYLINVNSFQEFSKYLIDLGFDFKFMDIETHEEIIF